jgi:UDP-N-acetylglucosamine--N-acetylmuramyl-(pentapeptide) pyrophosphoryl-undecaprenol N-acetylglucosamine transferase
VLLSYEESRRHLSGRAPVSVIGNPLRSMPRVSRAEGCEYFGLEPDRPTVLVIGGSRGAHSLNVAGADVAARLAATGAAQFVLLTGEHDYEAVRTALVDMADRVKVLRYLDDVHMAYAVADLAVARAGASTVFELAAWGVPAVFVPYPYAADDHQARNAAPLEENGGAVVIADRDLDAQRLSAVIADLLEDDERRSRMAAAMTAWARPDAARAAAALIADVLKKKTADEEPRVTPPRVPSPRRASLEVVRR